MFFGRKCWTRNLPFVNHEYRVGASAKVGFFRHNFRVCEKQSEKNLLLKHFLNSFINSKHSMFRFFDVVVFVKQHNLVQYIVWIESIFIHVV